MFFSFIFSLTIIFLPIGKAYREMAKLVLKPYWKRIIKDKNLLGKYEKGFGLIFNIIWFPIWLIFFIFYFVKWFFEMITIVWIPFAIVDFKIWKAMFLPIWIRVLNEDDYISYKVWKEINKVNEKENFKVVENKKLTKEEIKELEENEKELKLLQKKQELEKLKRKEELNKIIKENTNLVKNISKKTFLKIKSFFIKYIPILLKNIKKIEKQVLKEWKNVSKKITKKAQNIDTEKYKNMWLNNIEKVKTIKISNNVKKYSIFWIIIFILALIWNYSYDNFYYNNQIIKVWDNISLKKNPVFINYFNNNKIKIWFNDEENILSQYLMSARSYKNKSWYINYKIWWYSSMYSIKNRVNIEDIKERQNKLWVIVEKNENWKVDIITYNENIDELNLYNTKLFKELNAFTNRNTFYSSISEIYDNTIIMNSWIWNSIQSLFQIDELLKNINTEIRNNILIQWNYRNYILWLEIDDNKLIINLKYNFDSINISDKDIVEDWIYQILSNINEENKINYSSYNINFENNSIIVKATYKIAKSDLEEILNNKSLNIVDKLDYFTTKNNYY